MGVKRSRRRKETESKRKKASREKGDRDPEQKQRAGAGGWGGAETQKGQSLREKETKNPRRRGIETQHVAGTDTQRVPPNTAPQLSGCVGGKWGFLELCA